MIKIDFSFDTPHGKFADALHLPDDHGMTDAEIEAMKQQRLDNWLSHIADQSNKPPSKYQRDELGNLVLDENGDPILLVE